MIRLSSLLASVALGVVALPAVAQTDGIFPVQSIKYAGRFDVASNTFYPSDVDPSAAVSDADPVILYDNSTTNGYFSSGAGGAVATNHHQDWGTFSTTGGLGATVTEIRIAYATSVTAAQGVVGLRVRLYQGTAAGAANLGTVLGDYLISPLPNATTGTQGFTVDVTLPTAITVNDGPIGWSYNADNPVGVAATATGPLLAGPPNAAGTGVLKGAPATGFGAYNRINEGTGNWVNTILGASPVVTSFVIRLKGREIGAPPSAWQNYGTKQKVTFSGEGSATPGSVDNVLHVKVNPAGKSFILVAGLTQSDFFHAGVGLHFYAFPWLVQLAPIVTDAFSGNVDLLAPLPAELIPGTKLYLHCFGQNLAGNYVNWSEGLELTIQ